MPAPDPYQTKLSVADYLDQTVEGRSRVYIIRRGKGTAPMKLQARVYNSSPETVFLAFFHVRNGRLNMSSAPYRGNLPWSQDVYANTTFAGNSSPTALDAPAQYLMYIAKGDIPAQSQGRRIISLGVAVVR